MRVISICATGMWLVCGSFYAKAQQPVSVPDIVEQGQWDPLKANKDIEVGTFYMKKGDYDAAIDRFEEAKRVQPGLALPYLKLGETYEKMKNLPKAIESYKGYLEVYKKAPDAKDVQKKIQELEKKIARESNKPQRDSSLHSE